ncbi:MAG TPA: BTAD domain-containing putative transcriptional regulator [Candidatus Limnocylindrales bacterium]|jgi:DNA-binding SARP family transcriptional activator
MSHATRSGSTLTSGGGGASTEPLEIRLLGRFQVLRHGLELPATTFGGRLPRTIVRVLAVRRGALVPRDVLADILWGEVAPADPDANLDVLVHRARRALVDPKLIITGSSGYALADDGRVHVDVEAFRAAVVEGREHLARSDDARALHAFHRALDAWSGEPLAEDFYADWAQPHRLELQRLQLEALEAGARAALRLGDPTQATQLAEMAIVRDPLREPARLLFIQALAEAGDRAGALRAFEEMRQLFANELGAQVSADAIALHDRLRRRPTSPDELEPAPTTVAADEAAEVSAQLGGQGSGPRRALVLSSMAALAAGSESYERGGRLADLALLEAGADPGARAEALAVGAVVDMNLGRFERSKRRAQEALSLFEAAGDRHGMARVLDVQVMRDFMTGRIADATEAFARVATLFEESGDLLRVIVPRSTRGHGLVFMDRPREGLDEIDRALAVAEEMGHLESVAYCLWHRCEALAALGEPSQAIADGERALAIAEQLRHREWQAAAMCGLGLAYLADDNPVAAEHILRRALETAAGIPVFTSWAAARLARTLIMAERLAEAEEFVQQSLQQPVASALFEARLAQVELVGARNEPEFETLAAEALLVATTSGHLASARILRELLVK